MKKVILVGSGGYGAGYLPVIFEKGQELGWELVGVVDPYAAQGRLYNEILSRSIPIFNTLEEYFTERTADIACIATPIMLHADQAVFCLEHGCDVLLEKPVAGSVAEAKRIAEAAKRTGRSIVLGFQWCADPAMLAFKKDAGDGLFGKLLSQKVLVLWPRDFVYFNRGTKWAGKCFTKDGAPIFDSIASNATAHYLFNEMWLAGSDYTASAVNNLHWEASRANAIETYDTVEITGKTEGGAKLFFAASHAVAPEDQLNPVFEYRFEKGTAYFSRAGQEEKRLEVLLNDGSIKDYGISDNGSMAAKILRAAQVFDGKAENVCPIEAAIKHIEVLESLWNSGEKVCTLSEDELIRKEDRVIGIGIAEKLKEDYKNA